MKRGSAGFTLLEMLSVIAIIGVLAAIAIPSFGFLAASTKVKGASTELYLALIRARSEAVKRNRSVAIVANNLGWAAGWQIIADTNNDNDFTNADTVVINQGVLQRVTINLDCDGAPTETLSGVTEDNTRIKFRPSGRIVGEAGFCDGPPAFEVTSIDPDRGAALMRCIRADLTGRPFVTVTGVTATNC